MLTYLSDFLNLVDLNLIEYHHKLDPQNAIHVNDYYFEIAFRSHHYSHRFKNRRFAPSKICYIVNHYQSLKTLDYGVSYAAIDFINFLCH